MASNASDWIVCAAIKLGDGIFAVAQPPGRHNHILQHLGLNRHAAQGPVTVPESHQGFLTSSGRFVEREEAGKIALAAGQVKIGVLSSQNKKLYTEDMW